MIRLNKKIYPREVVLKAIQDFEKYCQVNMREKENSFHLEMADNKTELEFSNYCIGLMK